MEHFMTILPLVVAVIALVLAFVVARRSNSDSGSSVNLARLAQAVNDLSIKNGDLANNILVENNKRVQELQRLHSRIVRMEDFLLEMSCSTGQKRSFAEVCEKKKTIADDSAVSSAVVKATTDKLAKAKAYGAKADEHSIDEDRTANLSAVARPVYAQEVTEDEPAEMDELSEADLSAVASAKEEAPKSTIQSGLRKTRDRIFSGLSSLFGRTHALNSEFYEGLEGVLISSDLGVGTAAMVIERVKQEAARGEGMNEDRVIGILKGVIADILSSKNQEFYALNEAIHNKRPTIILMVGVNGVGKTTTVGKFASYFSDQKNSKVLVVAADTFRAAAVDQLQIWGQRSNVTVLFDENGRKPGAVVFDAIKKMKKETYDVMLIDTAGRLNNKANLMSELEALGNLIKREYPEALLEVVLVVDAATGQNALQQARDFNQAVKVKSMVVTKLDGTPKGGIVVAIKHELGIPIRFIGVGERLEDLKPFSVHDFVDGLIAAHKEVSYDGSDEVSPPHVVTGSEEAREPRRAVRRPNGG